MFTIPFNRNNLFKFYEGEDPDLYTDITGETLNRSSLELSTDVDLIVEEINNILVGKEKFEKVTTIDLEVLNSLKFSKILVKNTDRVLSFLSDEGSDNIILETYKGKFKKIEIDNLVISVTNENSKKIVNFLDNGDDKITFKTNEVLLENILLKTETDENDENVSYITIKEKDKETYLKIDSAYFLSSYINFGSSDLKDAIVYNDKDNGDSKNSYLFYADGKIENSTLIAGDIKTIGADVAEFYKTDKEYEPGTVLEVHHNSSEYDGTIFKGEGIVSSKLLGVVSEKPGLIIGEKTGNTLIALKGKVYVKVSNNVRKGDYVIADKNGFAKGVRELKSFKESLKLIGIALEYSKNNLVKVKV